MASDSPQAPLTLPVTDLTSATQFYLGALQPLGYCFVSQVQHQTATGSSVAVGLGPEGTTRVDVFLSQSQSDRRSSSINKIAHVVFPASSRHAVRDFYAAALRAGGKQIARPEDLQDIGGLFAATVTDPDGNKIEVCFVNADSSGQEATKGSTAALPATTQQPGGTIQKWRESVAQSTGASSVREGSTMYEQSQRRSYVPPPSMTAGRAPSRAPSQRSSVTARGRASSPADAAGGNKVVGTLIGAAAGAALAYTMVRSKQDSSSKERDFASRMAAKEQLREEARQHAARVDRGRDTRRSSHADRDSGYYSENPHYLDRSPTKIVHRSTTYPQGRSQGDRGRSGSSRALEYEPRTTSPKSYSQSTVRPPRCSQSSRGEKGSYVTRRLSSPTRYGPPPSLPPLPGYLSRHNSRGSDDAPRSRHTVPAMKERPPSSYHQPTTRSEALPRSRAASAHSSTRTARHAPLPPSAPPSTALTAKALSKPERVDPDPSRGALDDLKSVIPDDSISCVPYPNEVRERRGGHTSSRASDPHSRHSRHSRGGPRSGVAAA